MNTNKKLAAILLFTAYVVLFIITLFLIASSKINAQVPMLKLQLSNAKSTDATVVYYQEGATDGFDFKYDACKAYTPGNAVFIAQEYENDLVKINGIAPVSGNFSISILATTRQSGLHTISLMDYYRITPGTCIKLTDLFTGTLTDLLASDYTFILSDTVSVPRFILDVTYSSLPVITKVVKPACKNLNSAQIIVAAHNPGPWNYTWKDLSGRILKTSLSKNTPDTISGPGYGNFSVEVQTESGCNSGAADFFIDALPAASFSCADTFFLNSAQEWMAYNTSEHAANFQWSFGDGTENSANTDAIHRFSYPGQFEVKLIASSGNTFCADTAKKIVNVISRALPAEKIKLRSAIKTRFSLSYAGDEVLNAEVFNTSGNLVREKKINQRNTNSHFNYLPAGIFIMKTDKTGITNFTIH